jgi:hypothetical protein
MPVRLASVRAFAHGDDVEMKIEDAIAWVAVAGLMGVCGCGSTTIINNYASHLDAGDGSRPVDAGLLADHTATDAKQQSPDVAASTATDSGTSADAATGTKATGVATPTLVQHVSTTANPVGVGIGGNNFVFTLPNPVLAGNTLVLKLAYDDSVSFASTPVTDTNGNTWPTTPTATSTDANSTVRLAIFVLPNANAGTTTIKVSFNGVVIPFQYDATEWTNIAASSPFNGYSAASNLAAPNLSSGSFTPTVNNDANGGNLILSYCYDDSEPGSGRGMMPSPFVAGSGFVLLDADIGWNTDANAYHASEYYVQRTQAVANPGLTATGSSDRFNCLSIALLAASAGTAPSPTAMRIVHMSHFTSELNPSPWKLQFPSQGNLIIAFTADSYDIFNAQITDSNGNAWAHKEPSTGVAQVMVAVNAKTSNNLMATLTQSVGQGCSIAFIDVVNAATSPVDGTSSTCNGGCNVPSPTGSNPPNLVNTPSITPTSAGLTIAGVALGQGPAHGFYTGAPTGAIFDYIYYSGETDLDTMDNADGLAHLFNTTPNQAENWNWLVDSASVANQYWSVAVHFAAGP